MRCRWPWAIVVALVVLGLAPAPAPARQGHPKTGTTTVSDLLESWYAGAEVDIPSAVPSSAGPTALPTIQVPPDPCTLPTGCAPTLPVPTGAIPVNPSTAPTPYPVGTLHVEASGLAATARAFVAPDFAQLPEGVTVTSATITLPVNQQTASGNRSVDTADLVACLVTSPVTTGVAGGVAPTPTYSCGTLLRKAVHDSAHHTFTVDLVPFLRLWARGTPYYGIALVPDPRTTTPRAWHVALNGRDVTQGTSIRTAVGYTLPSVTLPSLSPTVTPTATPTVTATPSVTATATPPPVGNPQPGAPPVSIDVPQVDTPPAASPPPVVAPPAPATTTTTTAPPALQPAPYTLLNSPWYTYRGVVFLPLAFLVAMVLTGRSLTRPLALAVRRRSWRRLGR